MIKKCYFGVDFGVLILLFLPDFHKYSFTVKFSKHPQKNFNVCQQKKYVFFEFTVHPGVEYDFRSFYYISLFFLVDGDSCVLDLKY